MARDITNCNLFMIFILGCWLFMCDSCQASPLEVELQPVRQPRVGGPAMTHYNEKSSLLGQEINIGQMCKETPPICPNFKENFYPCSGQRLIINSTNFLAGMIALLLAEGTHKASDVWPYKILGIGALFATVGYSIITYTLWWPKISDRRWVDIASPVVGFALSMTITFIILNNI